MENYYVAGDYVRYNNFQGIVTELSLRTTKIKSYTGEVMTVCNRNINEIINISQKEATVVIKIPVSHNIKINNLLDAGSIIYKEEQEIYSGGSGPACLPLVLFNKILLTKKYKKILIIGTGSLHNQTLVNQKNTIPAIAHAVTLEVI